MNASEFGAELQREMKQNQRLIYVTQGAEVMIRTWRHDLGRTLLITKSNENRSKVFSFFQIMSPGIKCYAIEHEIPFTKGPTPFAEVTIIAIDGVDSPAVDWLQYDQVVVCGLENLPRVSPKLRDNARLMVLAGAEDDQTRALAAQGYKILVHPEAAEYVFAHCLGANGYFTTETCHTPCYMVPRLGVVFDAGTGFFRVPPLCQTPALDIFLSHGHIDHVDGIRLISAMHVPVRIHAEKAVLDGLRVLFSEPFSHKSGVPAELCEIADLSPIKLDNGATVTPFRVVHTSPCLGFRLDYKAHTMCYVTDTNSTADAEYIGNVQGVNLLIHEAFYTSERLSTSRESGHTCGVQLAEFARAANVKRVVIAHQNPRGGTETVLAEVQQGFPNAELAREGHQYEF